MKITTIGLDLAKNVFQLHGVDERGRVMLKKQLKRARVLPFFAQLEPCLIGMEACGGAHHSGIAGPQRRAHDHDLHPHGTQRHPERGQESAGFLATSSRRRRGAATARAEGQSRLARRLNPRVIMLIVVLVFGAKPALDQIGIVEITPVVYPWPV